MHVPPDQDQATILVVDDQPSVVAAVRAMFAIRPKWKVHSVATFGEALDAAIALQPQVILQDMLLPDGDGLDLVERYVACRELPGVQVIMLSGDERPDSKAAAFDAGAFDYIVKMPSQAEFIVRVRHAVRQSEMIATQIRLLDEAEAANRRAEAQLVARMQAEKLLEERSRELAALNVRLQTDLSLRIETLNRIGADLHTLQDLDMLLKRLLAEARAAFGCEAGSILLREGDRLVFTYAQNDVLNIETRFPDPKRSPVHLPIDRTSIAGASAVDGLVLVRDAYDLPADVPFRFNRSFDEATGYRTRAVLAVAMRDSAHRLLGVLQLINPRAQGAHHGREFTEEDRKLAQHFAGLAAMALERSQLGRSMVLRMMRLAEMRDPKETGAHVKRVAEVAALLFQAWAERRNMPAREMERKLDLLRTAAMLHDLGKVAIPDSILKKPGRLDPDERAVMEMHPIHGARTLEGLSTALDEATADVILYHQARWDGRGYPSHQAIAAELARLGRRAEEVPAPAGPEIPIFARCVALADVFDALMSRRVYKDPWPPERVLETILAESGSHFDPELVEIFRDRFQALCAANQMFVE
jgi:response regulator RpfG family c-di-GMP phosphodiesterase